MALVINYSFANSKRGVRRDLVRRYYIVARCKHGTVSETMTCTRSEANARARELAHAYDIMYHLVTVTEAK